MLQPYEKKCYMFQSQTYAITVYINSADCRNTGNTYHRIEKLLAENYSYQQSVLLSYLMREGEWEKYSI